MVKEYMCPKLNKCNKDLKAFKRRKRESKQATVGVSYEDGDYRRPPSNASYFSVSWP